MYAVDFDLDSKGRLFVADRGDNRVKIYTGDGALESSVFINAPMSVVALANGQFAVVMPRGPVAAPPGYSCPPSTSIPLNLCQKKLVSSESVAWVQTWRGG